MSGAPGTRHPEPGTRNPGRGIEYFSPGRRCKTTYRSQESRPWVVESRQRREGRVCVKKRSMSVTRRPTHPNPADEWGTRHPGRAYRIFLTWPTLQNDRSFSGEQALGCGITSTARGKSVCEEVLGVCDSKTHSSEPRG